EVPPGEPGEGNPRNDRDAMIALLTVDRDMGIARVPERRVGEIGVRAFRLLEAENVRLVLVEIADDELDAQTHRIDVPGGDGKRHGEESGGGPCAACPGEGPSASLVRSLPTRRRYLRRLPSWLAGASSMWKSAGSGWALRSTLNRVTTV